MFKFLKDVFQPSPSRQPAKEITMAEPILHSVAQPPQAVEVKTKSAQLDSRVTALLQSIYTASRTAATSISIGKAVDCAGDSQAFVNADEILQFGHEAGYEAVQKVWKDAEELARLLGISLDEPNGYRLTPVYAGK
jgi:hypothetical protein